LRLSGGEAAQERSSELGTDGDGLAGRSVAGGVGAQKWVLLRRAGK